MLLHCCCIRLVFHISDSAFILLGMSACAHISEHFCEKPNSHADCGQSHNHCLKSVFQFAQKSYYIALPDSLSNPNIAFSPPGLMPGAAFLLHRENSSHQRDKPELPPTRLTSASAPEPAFSFRYCGLSLPILGGVSCLGRGS